MRHRPTKKDANNQNQYYRCRQFSNRSISLLQNLYSYILIVMKNIFSELWQHKIRMMSTYEGLVNELNMYLYVEKC